MIAYSIWLHGIFASSWLSLSFSGDCHIDFGGQSTMQYIVYRHHLLDQIQGSPGRALVELCVHQRGHILLWVYRQRPQGSVSISGDIIYSVFSYFVNNAKYSGVQQKNKNKKNHQKINASNVTMSTQFIFTNCCYCKIRNRKRCQSKYLVSTNLAEVKTIWRITYTRRYTGMWLNFSWEKFSISISITLKCILVDLDVQLISIFIGP